MTTRTRRAPRPVSLTKPSTANVMPSRIVAGGLVWTADEDWRPYQAVIGWEVARKLGVAEPAEKTS